MTLRKWLLILSIYILTNFSLAANSGQIGITLGIPVISEDPANLHGYRASLWYMPDLFAWKHFQIYFDGAYAHYWVNQSSFGSDSLSIYSVSPLFRLYYMDKYPNIRPFIDFSVGLSYLSKTHMADRRFGMHFAFQDLVSFGVVLGDKHQFTFSGTIMHYSNGSLAKTNAGITIPLLLNVGYRF